MPLSSDEVDDLVDSWEFDPDVDTVARATELLATMSVGDPGRIDVLQVIADHQAVRGDVDAALATLDQAADARGEDADVVQAMRICFLLGAGRDEEADPMLQTLRRRGSELPGAALDRIADTLEEAGRLREAMRWHTIALRDLDPQQDIPDGEEEYALFGRWRVRKALELPPDHFDNLARSILDERRSGRTDDWD